MGTVVAAVAAVVGDVGSVGGSVGASAPVAAVVGSAGACWFVIDLWFAWDVHFRFEFGCEIHARSESGNHFFLF